MGFLDKLKNAFFEEEVVEEDTTKLAKKIEIPKKKVGVTPIVPKENVKVPVEEKEEKSIKREEPIIEEPQEEVLEKNTKSFPMMFEEEDFFEEKEEKPLTREERLNKKELYQGKKEVSYAESVTKTPNYTYSNTRYEVKETKGFKPSPIISPIYGILDKNYKKEEVITKKEIRISNTSYGKVDLDSVRDKAFGNDAVKKVVEDSKEKKSEEKVIYDVNSSKPAVSKVTLADADEYYNDLGLAYNVDYNDDSRATANTRTTRYHEDDRKNSKQEEDNLFDLIESMYDKED